jgi:hypothetical protein
MNAVVPDGVIVAAERLHNLPDLVRHLQLGQLHYVPAQADFSLVWFFRSVADPDQYFFGPPGFGSISARCWSGSGSFYHQAKIVRKTLITTVLWLLYDFLSLKNGVDVASKNNKKQI